MLKRWFKVIDTFVRTSKVRLGGSREARRGGDEAGGRGEGDGGGEGVQLCYAFGGVLLTGG